jgi:hypothetical protein
MDDPGIKTFGDWLNSGCGNGYVFRTDIRLIPGNNDAFYWRPIGKVVNEGYLRAQAYDERQGRFFPIGEALELGLLSHNNDRAIKTDESTLIK